MSETALQLLAIFESLPPSEQHEFLVAMLRRSGEVSHRIVSDADLVGVSDELFQALDAEEADGCTMGAGRTRGD